MKIFVAYGYNERDKWIKELVFPIIRAFGAEVETGEETFNGTITDVVRGKILLSDALIAFTTRKEPENPASTITHQWVRDELVIAADRGKKIVEIRERGVDLQNGILSNYQRIEYDETARDKCLVEIVRAIGDWQRKKFVRVQLLPEGIRADLWRLLSDNNLSCNYRVKIGNSTSDDVPVKIEKIGMGLFVYVPQTNSEELIQISIKYNGSVWESSYESLNSYGISLEKVKS